MRFWIVALVVVWSVWASAATPKDERDRVTAFLQKTFPGKTWDGGPVELESDALKASYPGVRFYAVWSDEPVPSGAPPPAGLHQTFSDRLQEFRATHVTAVVRVDRKGRLSLQQDVNAGLRRARKDTEMRAACAAVFSITSGSRAPPAAIELDGVSVERLDGGWSCNVKQPEAIGNAFFDARGKCMNVSKTSTAPLPPSVPSRPAMP